MPKIDIIKHGWSHTVINKPYGISSFGKEAGGAFDQLVLEGKLNPEDIPKFRFVTNLGRKQTGGVIGTAFQTFAFKHHSAARRRGMFYEKIDDCQFSFRAQYVGLFALPDTVDINNYFESIRSRYFKINTITMQGFIDSDVTMVEQEGSVKLIKTRPAETSFTILEGKRPSTDLIDKYPKLFKSKIIYPIIMRPVRRNFDNQIMSHFNDNFGIPFLNDINYKADKGHELTFGRGNFHLEPSIFKSDQIALHCAHIHIGQRKLKENFMFPIYNKEDRELWTGFLQEDGYFIDEIQYNLVNYAKRFQRKADYPFPIFKALGITKIHK
ncbi:uncharacterized protein RJT21DRAFT_33849 [Scheffersomyces amazonensis]|uniref:uncharacterized protein n=1 Tax=Scheffersomyces amazonensis TaxID=1078765 RepID=UPI00315D46F6